MAVAVPGGFRDAGASLPAVAPLPVAAHPEPVAIRVSDVEWLHQIRVVLLLRYLDRDGSRAVVRRVRFPCGWRIANQPRNPLRLSSLVILGVVARMSRCATRSSYWFT